MDDGRHEDGAVSVLVVDDEADAAEALAGTLEGWGWRCSVCTSGDAALRYLRTSMPDLILLGVGTGETSGFELAPRIRQLGEPAPVIVAVTERSSAHAMSRAMEVGIDGYVIKPVRSAELLRETLEEILERPR